MAGYTIELYKYIMTNNEYKGKNRKIPGNAYTTFGNFDLMAISKTTAFTRMRDVSKFSRSWIGDRQSILLYELPNNNNDVTYLLKDENHEEDGFYINSGSSVQKSNDLFIGVSILQFKEYLDKNDINNTAKKYITNCRSTILRIVKEWEGCQVHCSVFGILGSYGVAVLWTADQYTDILKLINIIKGKDIVAETETLREGNPYLSVYTIFSINKIDKAIFKEKIEKVEGDALLRITLQTDLKNEIRKALMKALQATDTSHQSSASDDQKPVYEELHSVGEHDWMIKAPAKCLLELYEDKKILDRANETFYSRYLLQTSTKLCDVLEYLKDTNELSETESTNSPNEEKEDLKQKEIEKSYSRIRKLMFDVFPKTAGMVDSLDLLYGDYSSKIGTVSNKMWMNDFTYQFQAILGVFESNLNDLQYDRSGLKTSQILESFRDILNSFEYQIIHIAESNNLLVETPKCHLRYTGQNNISMYAYYGIVKDILSLVYQNQKFCKQSEIVPMISVDSVPIIESKIYMDNGKPFEQKLLKLNLPMMALYNIPIYVPYLLHEIFHYVVPRDRFSRNWHRGNLLIILAMRNLLFNMLGVGRAKYLQDEKIRFVFVYNVLLPRVYQSVLEKRWKEVPALIKEHDNCSIKNGDVNSMNLTGNALYNSVISETCCPRQEYEHRLIGSLCDCLKHPEEMILEDNIAFHVLHNLSIQRDRLICETEKWANNSNLKASVSEVVNEVKSFLDWIDGFSERNNISQEKRIETFKDKMKSIGLDPTSLIDHKCLHHVSVAVTEAVCDLAMVKLAGIEAVHYLLNYVKVQEDLLISVKVIQSQDVIRIGIVLDNLFGFDKHENKPRLEKLSEQFVDLYTGMHFSIKESTNIGENFTDTEKDQKLVSYYLKLADDAKMWLKKIVEWYSIYEEEYRFFASIFTSIIDQYAIDENLSIGNVNNNFFSSLKCKCYYQYMQDYGQEIRKVCVDKKIRTYELKIAAIEKARSEFREEAFKMNVDIIQQYQMQENFYNIQSQHNKHFKQEELYSVDLQEYGNAGIVTGMNDQNARMVSATRRKAVYEIENAEELLKVMQKISVHFKKRNQVVYTDKEHNLWYRGMSSINFKLLPSAMWRLAGKADKVSRLCDFQRMQYEEFKFRQDDSSESIDTSKYTACDYLALMQHYGIPTIYLDWSENALTSLYFALEAYIDPQKASNKNDENAVLYVLNPNLYNKARNELMDTYNKRSGKKIIDFLQKTKSNSTENLPNLSVDYNNDTYFMYLLGDGGEKFSQADLPDDDIGDALRKGSEELLYLPLAVYSSRANMRIRKQYGMFMAYNIFTPPSTLHNYDYMALEEIQNAYLEIFADAEPFMYKIEIKSGSKERIADWLKAVGISKDIIYPELSNISERIS